MDSKLKRFNLFEVCFGTGWTALDVIQYCIYHFELNMIT